MWLINVGYFFRNYRSIKDYIRMFWKFYVYNYIFMLEIFNLLILNYWEVEFKYIIMEGKRIILKLKEFWNLVIIELFLIFEEVMLIFCLYLFYNVSIILILKL